MERAGKVMVIGTGVLEVAAFALAIGTRHPPFPEADARPLTAAFLKA